MVESASIHRKLLAANQAPKGPPCSTHTQATTTNTVPLAQAPQNVIKRWLRAHPTHLPLLSPSIHRYTRPACALLHAPHSSSPPPHGPRTLYNFGCQPLFTNQPCHTNPTTTDTHPSSIAVGDTATATGTTIAWVAMAIARTVVLTATSATTASTTTSSPATWCTWRSPPTT